MQQDAEKVRQQRSRFIEILNGDPAASLIRRRAQTWCSLFVVPCAPEDTPPVSTRLRPCWTAFLSILRECSPVVPRVRTIKILAYQHSFSAAC
jgi:hypothetical protein